MININQISIENCNIQQILCIQDLNWATQILQFMGSTMWNFSWILNENKSILDFVIETWNLAFQRSFCIFSKPNLMNNNSFILIFKPSLLWISKVKAFFKLQTRKKKSPIKSMMKVFFFTLSTLRTVLILKTVSAISRKKFLSKPLKQFIQYSYEYVQSLPFQVMILCFLSTR